MAYKKGQDRRQRVLFPDCIDEYVEADAPVRLFDAFVDNLKMDEPGFVRSTPAETGTPGYDPRDLLKLYIYGYFYQVRSSRKLARECKCNVEVMWLLNKLTFYYHPDHLGSSSYITNLDGEVVQYIEYVPFGEVFIEERNNIWNTPYLFNAKEFDEETGMYYYGARYYESRLSLWMSVDRFAEKYKTSPYCFTLDNPICHYDERGDSTILYATRLPMDNKKIQSALSMATHTFMSLKRNGKPSVKFSFGSKTDNPFGGQLVKVSYMDEEKSMKGEAPSNFVKNRIVITPPSGMTVEQFDEMVIKTGNSFGNNPNITYCLEPFEQTQGNCNSSSSTLLYKAGVPLSRIKDLRK